MHVIGNKLASKGVGSFVITIYSSPTNITPDMMTREAKVAMLF